MLDPFCKLRHGVRERREPELGSGSGLTVAILAARLVESRLRDEFGVSPKSKPDGCSTPHGHRCVLNRRAHEHQLFGRQDGRCAWLAGGFPVPQLHHRSHRVPRNAGGTDHIDNLQLLCGACNSVKGLRDHAAIIADLEGAGHPAGAREGNQGNARRSAPGAGEIRAAPPPARAAAAAVHGGSPCSERSDHRKKSAPAGIPPPIQRRVSAV